MVSGLFEKRNLRVWWYGLGKSPPKKCREADSEKRQVQGRSGCSPGLSHWAWVRNPAVMESWRAQHGASTPSLFCAHSWKLELTGASVSSTQIGFRVSLLFCLPKPKVSALIIRWDRSWEGTSSLWNLVKWRLLPHAPLRRKNFPCLWRVQYPQMTSVALN